MSSNKSIISMKDIKTILNGNLPGQLIIQYTDICNAKCPQCGMRVTEKFKRSKLSMDDTKIMIEAAAKKGIRAVSFTGGEPLLFVDEIVELAQFAGSCGIDFIRTGTNGYLFMDSDKADYESRIRDLAEKFAKTKLRNLWISIDSASSEIHESMRGLPGVIEGIKKALPIFHEHGIYPAANLGINRNTGGSQVDSKGDIYDDFYDSFHKFYSFVIDLGFTMVNACYPMSVDDESELSAIYGATSTDSIVKFSKDEKIKIFKALFDTIPDFRDKIRIFTPRISLYSLIRQYSGDKEFGHPCRGGIDFFFVDSKDGNTYPCGYRGDTNLGKFWDIDMNSIDKRAFCRECDWECFRDPSEQLGYLSDIINRPIKALNTFTKEREYTKIWLEDIKYYGACDYYNGRIAPDYNKIKKFGRDAK